ncbi:MAG: hypothetical protein P9M07_08915 [Candidatus Aceula meridiana]|nr:hypothetical protein [Candidatus Aceula meridiana]
MIVSMKKIFLIVQKKDSLSTLDALRHVGVVHIENEKVPESANVILLKEQIGKLKTAVEFFESQPILTQEPLNDWEELLEEIIRDLHKIKQVKDDIKKRKTQIAKWERWGDFNLADFAELRTKGLCARLFKIPVKQLSNLPSDVICERIFVQEKVAYCLVVCKEQKSLPFEEVALPNLSLSDMKNAQVHDATSIKVMEGALAKDSFYLNEFKDILDGKIADLHVQEVLAGMGDAEEFSYLKGFCPNEVCPQLQAAAKKEKWGLIVEDPTDDDKIPTLLRNPKWIDMIKPVFSMMNILPGYKELDISFFFLAFLSIFFGILIGDAGYGFVFLLATFFADKKASSKIKDKSPFFLMYVLSSCAIVWGILTGTFFGQAWIAGRVNPLLPWLRNDENMQMLCFLIGAIHLSIAHLWRGIIKMPSVAALGEIGWLFILWGMYFVAKMLILGQALPSFVMTFFIGGAFLVVFFSQPKKNILKGIALGVGDLLMSVVNMFTDVVSYIRLFAVGLATVAVADAFNQMALEIGFGNVATGLATALILVLGHLLNITLGAMAILVHGIRLNVLEFSSHLNMEWSGIAYNPFKKTKKA